MTVNLDSALAQLREERNRAQKELGRLDEAISVLQKLAADHRAPARGPKARVRRKLSAAARKRISEAQKARWAKIKKRKAAA
jgi:hypothetical protein